MADFYDTLEEFMEGEIPEFTNWAERSNRRMAGTIVRRIDDNLITYMTSGNVWSPKPKRKNIKAKIVKDDLVDLVYKELSDI